MGDEDWTRIVERSDRFRDLKFDVVQAAGWTVDQIRAKSIQEQADIIFVDYLGLIASKGKASTSKLQMHLRRCIQWPRIQGLQ